MKSILTTLTISTLLAVPLIALADKDDHNEKHEHDDAECQLLHDELHETEHDHEKEHEKHQEMMDCMDYEGHDDDHHDDDHDDDDDD